MQLTLQSHNAGDVVVVRCRGRIVSGDEAAFLQSELEKLTELTKNVVLQLAEVSYMDSGGLGALVRIFGRLRAARGDLKLCEMSSFVGQVLRATSLLSVFNTYASEREAVEAFSGRPPAGGSSFQVASNRIVCLGSSRDLLAYLKVLLKDLGCEVFTTQYPSDAATLATGARSSVVICGPELAADGAAIEKLRQSAPNVQVLHLPADFSASEASQAGPELVSRVRSMLAPTR